MHCKSIVAYVHFGAVALGLQPTMMDVDASGQLHMQGMPMDEGKLSQQSKPCTVTKDKAGKYNGVTPESCEKCKSGYQWWPCKTRQCHCDGDSSPTTTTRKRTRTTTTRKRTRTTTTRKRTRTTTTRKRTRTTTTRKQKTTPTTTKKGTDTPLFDTPSSPLRCGTSWPDANKRACAECKTDGDCQKGQQCFADLTTGKELSTRGCNPGGGGGGGNPGGGGGGGNPGGGGGGGGGGNPGGGNNDKCPAKQVGDCKYDKSGAVAKWFKPAHFEKFFPYMGVGNCARGKTMLRYSCMIAAVQNINSRNTLNLFDSGNETDDKRELAAWFGVMAQETTGGSIHNGNTCPNKGKDCACQGGGWCRKQGEGCLEWGLCWVEEQNCPGAPFCEKYGGFAKSGQTYHGRGPKQLSWNYNYKAFSKYYCGDTTLLDYPERVADNSELAWASSIWFWVTGGPDNFKPGCHDVFTRKEGEGDRKPGLGWVINVVNGGLECNSAVPRCDRRVASRVSHYKHYCKLLGVKPLKPGWTEDNLYCDTQSAYVR